MKIYSDVLTGQDFYRACSGMPIYPARANLKGSRIQHFDVILRAMRDHGRSGMGNIPGKCATWDETGVWMARLFDKDPALRIVSFRKYDGKEDFHSQTEGRYTGSDAERLSVLDND